MKMMHKPALMHLTASAVAQVNHLLAVRGKPALGIRIGIRTRGCSGLAYNIEYADAKMPMDEEVQQDGVMIYIDPKAIMFVLGTEMDFVKDELQSGFVFTNPNEKGKCGCGQSFHV